MLALDRLKPILRKKPEQRTPSFCVTIVITVYKYISRFSFTESLTNLISRMERDGCETPVHIVTMESLLEFMAFELREYTVRNVYLFGR